MLPQILFAMPQMIAVAAVSFLFIFAWLGADWATRFQYVVMSLLVVAILSFLVGGLDEWDVNLLAQNWSSPLDGPGFWILFAIFFPAVTGFTQGVSMSGDLKDPGKSLPWGTFSAVGLSILVYFGVAIVFAGVMPNDQLTRDYAAMKRVARIHFLIDAGVIGATLSSAMASFLGAPRILQSLTSDRVFPFLLPFAHGVGPANNPRRGVLLATAIALATIGLGKLNLIAPVVSMFFLISYGLLNYATFFEARTSSPSFRPRFRWFDLRLSLLGFLACLGAMLAINLAAGTVAAAVLFAIYHYLKRTAGPARWADSTRSYHLQHLREHLLAAAAEPEHPRDWRPQLLALSNDSKRRGQLLHFASWIEGGSGFTTAVRIVQGEGVKMLKAREEAEKELRADIAKHESEAFPLVLVAPNVETGIYTLVQAYGVGPLKANTILLNWIGQLPARLFDYRETRYGQNLRTAFRLGCNIVILDAKEAQWSTLYEIPANRRRIDVWWSGGATSHLMLLLAYLMTRNEAWQGATIRVIGAGSGAPTIETMKALKATLEDVRIDAEVDVVADRDKETLVNYSKDAATVFLPFRLRKEGLTDVFGHKAKQLLPSLPVVALVLAAEDIDLDAEPEEGKAGEMAAALDAVEEAKKKAEEAVVKADEAKQKAQEAIQEARKAIFSGADEEAVDELDKAAEQAKAEAEKTARRAAKASVKAEDTAQAAEALGATPAESNGEPEK
jgi:hypothetical protein